MDVRIVDKDDFNITFIVTETDAAFVNALRRIMMAEVPIYAIEDVVIVENQSAFFDEIVAHRLGLIPLKMDVENYDYRQYYENPEEFQVVFTLEKEASDGPITVYSGDLESEDPSIKPVYDNIPILKLGTGNRIVVEAYARLGIGKEHAKWQPVSSASYKYMPRIIINRDKCDLCKRCVEACPRNILEVRDDALIIKNLLECNLCRSCEEVCEKDAIKVEWDKNQFIFKLESTGSLPPEKIVETASLILKDKAEKLLEDIGEKVVERQE
ncbi:MAG: DNA-directed RNA polymerase subunit D [Candidatus Asgardarchaeia archaeon]